jgi:uncharacterized peroxidase-related enzyme
MSYLTVPQGAPGIIGLMQSRPDTAGPLNAVADVLLNTDKFDFSRSERELVAAYVSWRNKCNFCHRSHRAFSERVADDRSVIERVFANTEEPDLSHLTDRMKALLHIAGKVQGDARTVSIEDIDAARAAGATDEVIHDAVLIAAAFCMFNRYVDGLGTFAPPAGHESYAHTADMIAEHGYNMKF